MVSPDNIIYGDYRELPYLEQFFEPVGRLAAHEEEVDALIRERLFDLEHEYRSQGYYKRDLGYGMHAYWDKKPWVRPKNVYGIMRMDFKNLSDYSPALCTEYLWENIEDKNRELCPRWRDKSTFVHEVGPMPHPVHLEGRLARIDDFGPLSPSNSIFLIGDRTPYDTAIRRAARAGIGKGLTQLFPAEYRAWSNMKRRCTNPNTNSYIVEGMDEHWETAAYFIRDMGAGPGSRFSLARIDKSEPYCKANCKWVNSYGVPTEAYTPTERVLGEDVGYGA